MKVAMSRIHGLGQTDLSAGFAYTATTPQTGSANNLSSGFSYVCDPTDLSCQLNQLPVETTTPAALQTQVLNAALAPGTVAPASASSGLVIGIAAVVVFGLLIAMKR